MVQIFLDAGKLPAPFVYRPPYTPTALHFPEEKVFSKNVIKIDSRVPPTLVSKLETNSANIKERIFESTTISHFAQQTRPYEDDIK